MDKARLCAPHPLSALVFFAWVLAVQLTGLAAFTKGFFLTRVELGRQSQCEIQSLLSTEELEHLSGVALHEQRRKREGTYSAAVEQQQPNQEEHLRLDGCWLPPRFKRVVWVVVDALRYDFAAYSPPAHVEGGLENKAHSAGARHYLNHLPVISEAIGGTRSNNNNNINNNNNASSSAFEGSGGVLFQFEADPPTVTMQRLKGLTTGGLPTFIDFRDNFHSPEVAEDNWVAQVRERAARRRQAGQDGAGGGGGGELVFMGDDTWTSLYPTYFSRSYPFPSFNTRDLHTVDDGVLSHLSTELAKRDWDVLVAHFLGVDHVGHTFGPASQAMEEKLDQMNAALRTVFEGVDDETVVFVLGDHGMTEDGNHGGATPEETGAALLVWSRSGERLLGPGFAQNGAAKEKARRKRNREDEKSGGGGDNDDYGPSSGTLGGREEGSAVDGKETGLREAAAAGGSAAEDHPGGDGRARPNVTGRKVAQIDLVPTISLLLGTPIPFGSLGGVIPEVFVGQYVDGGEAEERAVGDDDPRYLERLCDALLVNSIQVWRYLNEYAGVASIPARDVFDLQELLLAARDAHTEWRRWQHRRSQNTGGGKADTEFSAVSAKELRRVCDMYREFLDSSIGLGRSLWTQYDTGLMWWGLAVLLAATASLAFRVGFSSCPPGAAAAVNRSGVSSNSSSLGVAAASVGAVGSVAIAALTDAVFGYSGGHVFAAKVAACSSLGVCVHYAQAIAMRVGDGGGGGGGGGGDGMLGGTVHASSGNKIMGAAGGVTGAAGGTVVFSTALTAGLSVLYCAGLFSNSFIEAEDGLHRFLGASSLLSLSVLFLLVRPPTRASSTGGTSTAGSSISRCSDDWLGSLFGLSRMSTAALYAALAAACLRAAASVQESATEGGVSVEAAFGTARSLLPLPALWWLCRLARGGGSNTSPDGGGREAAATPAANDAVINARGSSSTSSRRKGGIGADCRGNGVSGALMLWFARNGCLHGFLQALSLAAVGVYWANEVVWAAAGAGEGHGKATATAAADGMTGNGQGGTSAAAAAAAMKGGQTEAAAALPSEFVPPMRLLLPRAAYLLCLAGLVAVLLCPPVRRRQRIQPSKKTEPYRGEEETGKVRGNARASLDAPGWGAEAPPFARALACTAGTVVSHLLPVVVLLLGPGSPGVVAFVSAACGCVLRSASLAAAAMGTAGAAVPLGALAVAWSVVGRAFFFLTGHHNQFSRLQYSAAFVGFDDFDFKVGGLLLFLNTFGTEILAALTLPLAAAAAASTSAAASATSEEYVHGRPFLVTGGGGGGSGSSAFGRAELSSPAPGRVNTATRSEQDQRPSPPPSRSPHAAEGGDALHDDGDDEAKAKAKEEAAAAEVLHAMERLSDLTLLLSSFRTFLSAANVSVQRGHLMLWAVFAPKFVFDATMQAVCGAAAVLAWAVVLAAYRAYFSSVSRLEARFSASSSNGGLGSFRAPLPARKKAR